MRCPRCGERETRVVDSRDLDEASIRRRRECETCGTRFTTYERIEAPRLMVGKRDGGRSDRSPVARRRKHGSGLVGHRQDGDGQAAVAGSDRLHPLRQRLLELRGYRDAQARGGQPLRPARERSVDQMSVLSDRDIATALTAGRVKVEPYDPADLQPSSIDLHLDRSFRVFRNNRYPFIDVRAPQPYLTEMLNVADDEPFVLHPGEFVLGQTIEWVELPDDLVARLEGKSSLGRLGLLIHSTAGYVD